MAGDDPDAMWRPGYTGGYGAPVAPIARTRHLRRVVARALAAAGVVALVAGGIAFVVYRPTAEPPGPPGALRLPDGATQRWAVHVDGLAVSIVAGSDRLVVVADEAQVDIVALDGRSGRERWRVTAPHGPIASLDVIGDVVVATAGAHGIATAVFGLDADDGAARWDDAVADLDRVVVDGGQLLVAHGGDRPGLELVDVTDGTSAATIDGDVSWNRARVLRRDEEDVELFDRATFELAARLPRTGTFADAALTDAGVVVAEGETISLVAHDGRVLDAIEIPSTTAGAPPQLDVLGPGGELVAVRSGTSTAVVSTADGRLTVQWSEADRLLVDWHVDASRPLVATATVTGSIVALPPEVADAATGVVLWDGPARYQRAAPGRVFDDDGFIDIVQASPQGSRPVVIGYDVDRVERWRLPISGVMDVTLIDRAIVTVEPSIVGVGSNLVLAR